MYLRHFASDRSHMREGNGWLAPPPTYEPISTHESLHSLPNYMNFPNSSECLDSLAYEQLESLPFGAVVTENGFCSFFDVNQ